MHSGEQKVLGVRWNVVADQFVFNLSDVVHLVRDLEPTKRQVVSIVGKFYNPMGFMSLVIIRFKMLFQDLCDSKLDWDQTLSGNLLKKWNSLITEFQEAQPISIPRCYLHGVYQEVESYSLHGFCDASIGAYAAVVYLLMKMDTNHYVKFITSKTRVSPIHDQTIPRLELLSALLLAKLITSVTHSLESELPLNQSRCFTDFNVALFWIQGFGKEWKPFVKNRVNEIRKLLPIDCWNHCSRKDNPVDIPSRGLAPLELSVNMLWRNGPSWLTDMETIQEVQGFPMPEQCVTEMKAKDHNSVHSLLISEEPIGLGRIMKCQDYRLLHRLLSVMAYLLRFVKLLKSKIKSDAGIEPTSRVVEMSESETLWIIESQLLLTRDRNFDNWKKSTESTRQSLLQRRKYRNHPYSPREEDEVPQQYFKPILEKMAKPIFVRIKRLSSLRQGKI